MFAKEKEEKKKERELRKWLVKGFQLRRTVPMSLPGRAEQARITECELILTNFWLIPGFREGIHGNRKNGDVSLLCPGRL